MPKVWYSKKQIDQAIKALNAYASKGIIPQQIVDDYKVNLSYAYRGVRNYSYEKLVLECPDFVVRLFVTDEKELEKKGE